MRQKNHCHFCGAPLQRKWVEGRRRLYCDGCRSTIYENPLPATCVLVVNPREQVLLVQRSVDPRKGEWCLPGGFIEIGESPEAGALRELAEETGLAGTIECLLGVCGTPSAYYDSILMVGYLVRQFHGDLVAGDDAQQAAWFDHEQLPPIAFDSHAFFIRKFFRPGASQAECPPG